MDVGRTQQNAAQTAPGHYREIALGRLALYRLGHVIVAQMLGHQMVDHVLLVRRGKTARLALEKLDRRLRLGRDLEHHRLGIVQEKVRQILQLVGVGVVLDLADDGAQGARFRQNLDFRFERLLDGTGRTGGVGARFAVELARRTVVPFTDGTPLARVRTATARRGNFYSGIFTRPIWSEIQRAQIQHFVIHTHILYHKFRRLCAPNSIFVATWRRPACR